MNKRWLALLLLACGVLLLAPACTTRTTETPSPPLIPSTPKPTQSPVTQLPTTPQPTPDLVSRPAMTVSGTLESGVPFGVTADGHYFKGDPKAPVMLIEFSDYQ